MFASAERYDCSQAIKGESLSTEECKHRAYSLVPSYHSTTLHLIHYIHFPCLVQDVAGIYSVTTYECKGVNKCKEGKGLIIASVFVHGLTSRVR